MRFTNTLIKDSLKTDYQKLKKVLHNKSNNSHHLQSITSYINLFRNKHNLLEDNIVILELEELYNNFQQSIN